MDILEKYKQESRGQDTEAKLQEYKVERYDPETPKIIQWVMKYSGGLVKDQKQANYVLIGFAGMVIVLSLFLISSSYGGRSLTLPPTPGPDYYALPSQK